MAEVTNTETNPDGSTNITYDPGFTASDTCCACGKPDTPITEQVYNEEKSRDAGIGMLIYLIFYGVANTLTVLINLIIDFTS